MEAQENYQERFIAFIDILGFKAHVERTVVDKAHFQTINNVLTTIFERKVQNEGGTLSLKMIGKEIAVFSDSIVISYPASYPSAGFHLILDVIHLQLEMLYSGILMRGGITFGLLYHKDNIVFGPAMIAAYHLENDEAVVPRVLLDDHFIEHAISNGTHDREHEEEAIMELLLIDNDDGRHFVDFLSQWLEIDTEEEYLEALDITKGVIEQSLQVFQKNENVLRKYTWLKDYYNATLEKLRPEYTEGQFIGQAPSISRPF